MAYQWRKEDMISLTEFWLRAIDSYHLALGMDFTSMDRQFILMLCAKFRSEYIGTAVIEEEEIYRKWADMSNNFAANPQFLLENIKNSFFINMEFE